ncbi:MAG TPA: S8 family peptidase [Steroidobacteraceae bacterium]|nr:S8 family peptidase [Steroidobacteraceae bacterium]
MKVRQKNWLTTAVTLGVIFCVSLERDQFALRAGSAAASAGRQDYIVQAASDSAAAQAVLRVGGEITRNLAVIRAVGARLDDRQVAALRGGGGAGLELYSDRTVKASGTLPETYYPSEVDARNLHLGGTTGSGVTVAVVDSGLWSQHGPDQSAPGQGGSRILAQYDVLSAGLLGGLTSLSSSNTANVNDGFGHGTHVASIIASSGVATTGNFQGVAPGVNLVAVRVLDANGMGSYSNVIAGIQWVIAQKSRYNIRVMNLSLSAPPHSFYWQDPLNQAVMAAWNAGIVVVVAAGNAGPAPMTIGVPGNVPYVITVGAVTDSFHPLQPSQYKLASFSSAGPTWEGFVKPEVVAMGGHILAYAPNNSTLAQEFPQWVVMPYDDFTMTGTSMAAAVTSGAVALMLDVNPSLSPDDVKCRLMTGARPAVNADGTLAYTVFQQGSGLIDAYGAAYATAKGCANQGLNVAADLLGWQHFGGRANYNPSTGEYFIMATTGGSTSTSSGLLGGLGGLIGGLGTTVSQVPLVGPVLGSLLWDVAQLGDGLLWNGSYSSASGYAWSSGYPWSSGYAWSSGYPWSSGYAWSSGYPWSSGYAWSSAYTGTPAVPAQQ